jgi:hypothetical protein
MKTDKAEKETPAPVETGNAMEVFASEANFRMAQRIGTALSESSLVPTAYQKNLPNCLIAIEMAYRLRCSPLMVMQNLHVIQGRPTWSSAFIIATVNACGRFSPLQFELSGAGADRRCIAFAKDLRTGLLLHGPEVNMTMAKAEGWSERAGSKWKTMPELMLRYRAAAFFGRLYAPDMLLGMQSAEEMGDVIDVTPFEPPAPGVKGAKQLLQQGLELGGAP